MLPAFELSFAGYPFVIPDEGTLATVRAWMGSTSPRTMDDPPYLGPTSEELGTPPGPPPDWLDLYELYEPSGATCWSVFRGLAHRTDVAGMKTATLSSVPALGVFKMRVDSGAGINSAYYLLPPEPIVGLNGVADLYLITLVDERFFWQATPAYTNNPSYYTDWFTYIDAVRQQLFSRGIGPGVFAGFSASEAVYGLPEVDSGLWANGESSGALLDAALAACGRFVYRLSDGSGFGIARWDTAAATLTNALTAAAPDLMAGGRTYSPDMTLADTARNPIVPGSVTITFPFWSDAGGYETTDLNAHRYRSRAAGPSFDSCYFKQLSPVDLGAPYASLAVNSKWALNVASLAKAVTATPGGVISNQAALDALAVQVAKDVYDQVVVSGDVRYRGVQTFDPASGLDRVYTYWPTPSTRVVRRPWNRFPKVLAHGFGARSAPDLTINQTKVSGGTANGVLYSDGSKLQSAANVQIVGGAPYIQAAAGKWFGFSVGSH